MPNILLLEDDPNLAKSLVKYLQANGYLVDWVKHGEEAADMSYQKRYDLYLFDVNVPLLNGIELLKSLREAEDRTPTIFISAQIDLKSMEKGFAVGADDYIKKPFDPDELLLRVKSKTQAFKQRVKVHDFSLDLISNNIYYRDTLFSMGDVQKSIFIELLKAYPNPVPKELLMEYLLTQNDGALRVNIVKLKKETGLEIVAVRGVGYKIL